MLWCLKIQIYEFHYYLTVFWYFFATVYCFSKYKSVIFMLLLFSSVHKNHHIIVTDAVWILKQRKMNKCLLIYSYWLGVRTLFILSDPGTLNYCLRPSDIEIAKTLILNKKWPQDLNDSIHSNESGRIRWVVYRNRRLETFHV